MSSVTFPDYWCEYPLDHGCCGARATHRQSGRGVVCNAHLDNSRRAPRAFALND